VLEDLAGLLKRKHPEILVLAAGVASRRQDSTDQRTHEYEGGVKERSLGVAIALDVPLHVVDVEGHLHGLHDLAE
jgi:hypothetical protein